MSRTIHLLVILLCFLPGRAAAMTLADKVEEHRLENGATLLMVERHDAPTVAAYISFRVGAVNESSSERGVAHLLEHMLFKGTRTLGTTDYAREKRLLEDIEQVGGEIDALKNKPATGRAELQRLRETLAQLQQDHRRYVVKDEFSRIYAENGGVGYNAFTGKDSTTYLINLPANKLELWAAIESDRLQNAVFREFYTERDVVREERRRSYESSPDGMLYETLLATAYKVHPYRNPIIGWESDIENIGPAEIKSFFQRYYRPANMVITLVGDFDGDAARQLVERYFGRLDPGVPVPPVVDREPPQNGERRVQIDFDAEDRLLIAFHKPTLPHPDDYAFDILMQALTDGRTSRLYRSLVIERALVTSVDVFSAPGARYDNLMVLSLSPRGEHTPAEVEAVVYQELEQLKSAPLTTFEVDKARNRIAAGMLRGLTGNGGLARMLSSYQLLGDWRYLVDYEQKLKAVTAEDVMRVARQYLRAGNRTVAILSRGEQG